MKLFSYLLASVCFTSFSLSAQSGETYQFKDEVKMKMKQFKNDKEEASFDYAFLYPEEGSVIGMVGNFATQGQRMEAKAIFKPEEESILTLIDHGGMKMGMRMSAAEAKEKAGDGDMGKVQSTGRTKEIMGYTAEEYEIIDDDMYSLVWLTEEVDLPSFYDAFASMNQRQKMMRGDIPKGFMLAMTTWPEGKDGTDKIVMEVVEINKDIDASISTEGYRIMDMPTR